MKPQTLLFKARRAVRLHGVRGAVEWAWQRATDQLLFTESHVWYELDLTAERRKRELQQGLVLRRGRTPDLASLKDIETVSPDEALERINDGNDLWLVLEGKHLRFSCWIFRRRTPVLAAPDGQLSLPPDTVCLEDSVTAAAARGRGIAPAAWSAIADDVASQGQRRIITKVTVENLASRKAVEKAGFDPVALMRFRRFGPLSRTSVAALDANRGGFFVRSLHAPGQRRATITELGLPGV